MKVKYITDKCLKQDCDLQELLSYTTWEISAILLAQSSGISA